MTKETVFKEINDKLHERYWGYQRFMVVHNQEYKGITLLKKTLRKLTHEKPDFYKREYGFYNSNIEIFICNSNHHDVSTSGAMCFFANNEEDAQAIAEAIIEVMNRFYNRTTYYTVNLKDDFCDYVVEEHQYNEYEVMKEYRKRKGHMGINDIFEERVKAEQAIYSHLGAMIHEEEKKLRRLKQRQNEIEENIRKEWEKKS